MNSRVPVTYYWCDLTTGFLIITKSPVQLIQHENRLSCFLIEAWIEHVTKDYDITSDILTQVQIKHMQVVSYECESKLFKWLLCRSSNYMRATKLTTKQIRNSNQETRWEKWKFSPPNEITFCFHAPATWQHLLTRISTNRVVFSTFL